MNPTCNSQKIPLGSHHFDWNYFGFSDKFLIPGEIAYNCAFKMTGPETQLSSIDTGDDMQRRIRYQAACGALICLDLLVADDLEAVLCEHHEDFLIKKKSGMFIGVQVKTRLTAIGPFKANDSAIFSALTRFVALDIKFPERFEAFLIIANCDFYQAQNSETNLRYVIQKLKSNPQTSFTGETKKLIDDLHEANNCTKKKVREIIAKVRLDGSYPKFEDITGMLAHKIGRVRQDITFYPDLVSSANSILNHVLEASALSCDDVLRSHLILSSSPAEAAVMAIVEHKRITEGTVTSLLITISQPLLIPSTGNRLMLEFPVGSQILQNKMATGGISAQSIELAKDLQTSAEYVLQEWFGKYGGEMAEQRRAHIDLAVRTRCTEARDATYSSVAPFGGEMMAEVRKRIQELAIDKQHALDLKYEQLLGFVSLATQQCKIWWSDPFEIPEASDVAF